MLLFHSVLRTGLLRIVIVGTYLYIHNNNVRINRCTMENSRRGGFSAIGLGNRRDGWKTIREEKYIFGGSAGARLARPTKGCYWPPLTTIHIFTSKPPRARAHRWTTITPREQWRWRSYNYIPIYTRNNDDLPIEHTYPPTYLPTYHQYNTK